MNIKAQINIIKNILAKDDIDNGLKELRKLIADDKADAQKLAILISSKYSSLKKDHLAGLMDREEYSKEKQKIISSIIQVIDDLNDWTNEDQKISQLNLNINSWNKLPTALVESTWRKRNGLEEIFFISENIFSYTSTGRQKWLENDVSFDFENRLMRLKWRHDNFISKCKFNGNFSVFTELDETEWLLIAKEAYIHPTF